MTGQGGTGDIEWARQPLVPMQDGDAAAGSISIGSCFVAVAGYVNPNEEPVKLLGRLVGSAWKRKRLGGAAVWLLPTSTCVSGQGHGQGP